uniref:Uncharacterized protein n=1 Tax=Anguilla anguilla TaxID=7936 RepID=A0A0E9WHK6_ANGAN
MLTIWQYSIQPSFEIIFMQYTSYTVKSFCCQSVKEEFFFATFIFRLEFSHSNRNISKCSQVRLYNRL